MSTPSEELAKRIGSRLASEELLLNEDVEGLMRLLAEGKAKEGDWRLAIEKPIQKQDVMRSEQ